MSKWIGAAVVGLVLSAVCLVAIVVFTDALNGVLGGWGGFLALVAVAPAVGCACLIPGRRMASYWFGGIVACGTLPTGLLLLSSDVDEPVFPLWATALAAYVAMALALGTVGILLIAAPGLERLASHSVSHKTQE